MTYFFLFILGAIVGSFLNVVGLRWDLPRRGGVLSNFGGRSSCPNCGRILGWLELIPIISFFVLKAKCQGCNEKISLQYPIVELWMGLIFSSIFYAIGPTSLLSLVHYLLVVTVFAIFVVITIYDFMHKIIPDELVYSAVFLSLLVPLFFVEYSLLDWLSGPIIFVFFASIWLLSRGRAMGFGDAKLGLSVGLLLGATEGFSAIVLSFWIGALGSLIYIFLNKLGLPVGKAGFLKGAKSLTIKSEVPFAPFIIVATWISLILNLNILHVVSL